MIGIVHYGNEQVQQDGDHDDRVDAEHGDANEHGERVRGVQVLEPVFLHKAVDAPEQGLKRLE